jgi:catechol 2,3-dioxygenase-like lactoylglutathione lyase family enzyme
MHAMNAKINHLTIVSENNYALGRFYEGFFHMRPRGENGATQAVRIGDGYVGLTIKPRVSGQPAQLDHFGIEVDDIEATLARIGEGYPALEWLEHPGDGAIRSVSAHDPDGNVFSFSQTGANNRDAIEGDLGGEGRDRVIDHIALRVLHPERVAEFYVNVFDLSAVDGPSDGGNLYLSDGQITLVIIPWRFSDFELTGISAQGMDHLGFKVESIDALKADMDRVTAENHRFRPSNTVVGRGKEGAGRLDMFRKTCPLGCYHLADADGLLIDVLE